MNRYKGGNILKGIIFTIFKEFVEVKYGKNVYDNAINTLGNPAIVDTGDYDDSIAIKACELVGKQVNKTAMDILNEYGRFFPNSPKVNLVYKVFFLKKNAKDFLLNMAYVHEVVTKTVPNAKPPKFTYEVLGPDKIIMVYDSPRNLGKFFENLVIGVADKFNEKVSITTLPNAQPNTHKIEITFLNKEKYIK